MQGSVGMTVMLLDFNRGEEHAIRELGSALQR
jgi:hypothetical protein